MIHILTGAPCSGKSTYIKEHKAEGDVVVDFDEIAFCLGGKDHECESDVRDLTRFVRECAIRHIFMIPPKHDAWIIDSKPSGEFLELYQLAGADFVDLEVTKEECLERARRDGRPQTTIDGIERFFAEEKGNKMEHLTKSFNLKATDNGTIAGFFSTYEKTPDSYGDIIEAGAFTKTLEKRKESGHPFPLCFNHDFDKVIGVVDSIEEKENGPYIEAHFLDTELAQDVRKFVQSGVIYQFSFAYDVLKAREPNEEEKANGVMNVLQELDVFEISIVTVPANQNAIVTDVKTIAEPETKSGRRNRKADEAIIRNCIESLKSLLDEGEEDNTEKEEAKSEETEPEVNESSKEQKDNGNSKRALDLLEKINQFKGDSENES